MTTKMNVKNIKDRLKDETLDLSLCDLEEVPVKEIALVKKATHLDLSSNLLVSLPKNFVTLNHLVKLDLSRNMITEIPENFGEMRQLKHLDLYDNQISRLPLSLGELKNLRWLDLKENPLTPAVASVAGPCSDMAECQFCARNVVAFLSSVKENVEKEKKRKLNTMTESTEKETTVKKEGKKKKKKAEKTTDKESKKNVEKNGTQQVQQNSSESSKINVTVHEDVPVKKHIEESRSSKGAALYQAIKRIIVLLYILIFTSMLFIAVLPIYDKQLSSQILDYVEDRVYVGPMLRNYQRQTTDLFHVFIETTTAWLHCLHNALDQFYGNDEEIIDMIIP